LPAFALMVVLSVVYQAGHDLHVVASVFHGLQAIVLALIASAIVNFGQASIKNWRDLIPAVGAAALMVLHVNPILMIIAAAAVGFLLYRGMATPEAARSAGSAEGAHKLIRLPLYGIGIVALALTTLFLLDRTLFDLSAIMLKVDLFAFGGGFTSVPLMFHEVVDVRHWLDTRTFIDGIAMGQVTPGPIVITATFVGYQIAGLLGAVVGTIAVFTPSLLILLLTAPHLHRLQKSAIFRHCLRGVFASFCGLLFGVAINFGLSVSWNLLAVTIALAAFVALRLKVDILWVVLAGAGISVFIL